MLRMLSETLGARGRDGVPSCSLLHLVARASHEASLELIQELCLAASASRLKSLELNSLSLRDDPAHVFDLAGALANGHMDTLRLNVASLPAATFSSVLSAASTGSASNRVRELTFRVLSGRVPDLRLVLPVLSLPSLEVFQFSVRTAEPRDDPGQDQAIDLETAELVRGRHKLVVLELPAAIPATKAEMARVSAQVQKAISFLHASATADIGSAAVSLSSRVVGATARL